MQEKETLESENEIYGPDFDSLMEDIRIARKRNRQTKVLSVIALILSIASLIIRILMVQ